MSGETKSLRLRSEEIKVLGMHCATCEITVSKAISSVKGVKETNVNLASGNARVVIEGGKLGDVVKAVRSAGYDVATQKFTARVKVSEEEAHKLTALLESMDGVISAKVNASSGIAIVEINPLTTSAETVLEKMKERGYPLELEREEMGKSGDFRDLLLRLIVGALISPFTLIQVPFLQLVLSLPVVFFSGMRFHRGAYRALKNRTTNMDVLVSLSSLTAWTYSLVSLFYLHSGYFFDASSLLITFILAGKTLEAYIKERTSDEVLNLQSTKARLVSGETVDSRKLKVGDLVVVKSGEVVPADGVVDEGEGFVDESIYTGESLPVKKVKGDPLVGGSVLSSGFLKVYVTRSGERTYISQVVQALKEAETVRLPIQSIADRISSIFVPVIIAISIFSFLAWVLLLHQPETFGILIAVAILASACPCGFGLATPMAVMVGIRKLLKKGIVVRNGESLQKLREVKVIVFDKTGTLTKGEMSVREFREYQDGAIELASSLEKLSSHPVGRVIANMSGEKLKVEDFTELEGGVYGKVEGREVLVGKKELVTKNCDGEPKGDVSVCVDWKVAGDIWLEDKLRDGVKELVDELKRKYRVIIATGDSSVYADRVAQDLGVEIRKGLSPDGKVELVRELKREGVVCFVGDGVNDALSLREADIGVAVSSGTDIAKYAGDVVVPSVLSLKLLLERSKRTVRKIKENIAWALAYNAVLVPISAGVLFPSLGLVLPPEYAALGMAMNSVSVALWSFVQ
ncbi:cadmium-translocating P-type ATPase [Metallosphaera tengchongensis]|uniref:Cadmium-translocating P-type ATPase n=1 Tax=Metallosphaera tengchongensis TaxID=1532350 RepID=A0A6N0NYQ7_9CREN|nr:cation-translocating P-type ATPase [Metallosphaera tengchongensis]QKR00281.1 cadmium-translocating P-type ATPase [Metallosphaera tengchongensis]